MSRKTENAGLSMPVAQLSRIPPNPWISLLREGLSLHPFSVRGASTLDAASIVELDPYLKVFGDIGQFVRPIRTAGGICIIQSDVIKVDALHDVTVDSKLE